MSFMIIKEDEYFIKLPNNLVWTYEEGEKPITKDMNNKTIMVLSNLMFRCNLLRVCYFTLEDLIIKCGYTPRNGKGRTIEQFKNILLDLETLGYIVAPNVKIAEIKPNTFIECEINSNIIKNEDGEDEQFFRLFYKDYRKILDIDSKLDKDIMLNIYCYINSRILHRSDDDETEKYGIRMYGKAEYTFFKYKEITRDLNISETTFKEHLEILKESKLIFSDNIGLIEREGSRKIAGNIYCVRECELKPALNDSKFYYESEGYRLLGKKTDEGTKKIIGLDSRIKQLKEQGYDTTKHEKKLARLENDKQYKFDTRSEEKVLEDIKVLMKKVDNDFGFDKVRNIVNDFEREYYCKIKSIVKDKRLLMLLEKKLEKAC